MKISKLLGIMFCGLIMGTGSKSHDVYICESCPEGTYSDTGEGCKPCPPGTYTDKMGSSECKTCPPGYYSDDWGSPSCTICPKGHYCTEGNKYECSDGYYQNEEGKAECKVIIGPYPVIYFGYGTSYRKVNWSWHGCNTNYTCSNDICDGGCGRPWNSYCAFDADSECDCHLYWFTWKCYKCMGSAWVGGGAKIHIYCDKITGKREWRKGWIQY